MKPLRAWVKGAPGPYLGRVILGVAALASIFPARRANGVDPLEAIRAE